MLVLVHRYVRRMILALMLLLAASANCLSVSYDTNQNDDIPPVKVHFCFVASGRRMTAGKRITDSIEQASRSISRAGQDLPVMTEVAQGSTRASTGSLNLVVPLRR